MTNYSINQKVKECSDKLKLNDFDSVLGMCDNLIKNGISDYQIYLMSGYAKLLLQKHKEGIKDLCNAIMPLLRPLHGNKYYYHKIRDKAYGEIHEKLPEQPKKAGARSPKKMTSTQHSRYIEDFKNSLINMDHTLKNQNTDLSLAADLSVHLRKMLTDKKTNGFLQNLFPNLKICELANTSSDPMFSDKDLGYIAERENTTLAEFKSRLHPLRRLSWSEIGKKSGGRNLEINEWLETSILRCAGKQFSIREIIDVVANRRGAHSDINENQNIDSVLELCFSIGMIFEKIFKFSDYILSTVVCSKEYEEFWTENKIAPPRLCVEYSFAGEIVKRDYTYQGLSMHDTTNRSVGPKLTRGTMGKILKHLSKSGDVNAQFLYAFNFFEGTEFPKQTRDESLEYYKQSADGNNVYAQFNLGGLYFFGIKGFERDMCAGYWYIFLAVENGHLDAREFLIRHINDALKERELLNL